MLRAMGSIVTQTRSAYSPKLIALVAYSYCGGVCPVLFLPLTFHVCNSKSGPWCEFNQANNGFEIDTSNMFMQDKQKTNKARITNVRTSKICINKIK